MPHDLPALAWGAATVALYLLARAIHRRRPHALTSPLLLTWALCFGLALALHASYRTYLRGTHWLLALLGPAVTAFAVPIYEQRRIIRRHWPVLAIGTVAGSALAFASSWGLARALGLSPDLCRGLLPRSVTTPFALAFAGRVGGRPEFTATCVVLTGVLGASLGELLLAWMPLRSALARGALFGMGAHSVGTAKAREMGGLEGSVAGLIMVMAGILSVLAAPLFARLLP
jgi:predicted murein hydrolase (TIGR00659 family)